MSFKTTRPQEVQAIFVNPEVVPGEMSFTTDVPDAVPSENHSSVPSAAVVAIKKKPADVIPPKLPILMLLLPAPV